MDRRLHHVNDRAGQTPIGILTAVFARRLLPDDRGVGLEHGADIPGAVLLVSSLMLAVHTIVEASQYSWGSIHTLGLGAVAVALLAAFVARQASAKNHFCRSGCSAPGLSPGRT